VYLVRHGQAGTRDSYDSLSELGRRQSRLLGEYFLSQRIEFGTVYSGSLQRQRQTAEEVKSAYMHAGVSFPEIIIDDGWDEFDLSRVYREIGPVLSSEDPEFRGEYEEMRKQIKENYGVHDARVHRRWWPCDTKIVEAWVAGRFAYTGETWDAFRERITGCCERITDAGSQSHIIVFTSATPTGVLTAAALGAPVERIRQLAGVLYNGSYTLLRQRQEHLNLFQFNAVPHLTAPELRTHR